MLIHGFSLVNARLLMAFGTAFYAIMYNTFEILMPHYLTISLVLNNWAQIVKTQLNSSGEYLMELDQDVTYEIRSVKLHTVSEL